MGLRGTFFFFEKKKRTDLGVRIFPFSPSLSWKPEGKSVRDAGGRERKKRRKEKSERERVSLPLRFFFFFNAECSCRFSEVHLAEDSSDRLLKRLATLKDSPLFLLFWGWVGGREGGARFVSFHTGPKEDILEVEKEG